MKDSKDRLNDSPKPKDNVSDSSSYDEFDLYGLNTQVLLLILSNGYQKKGSLDVKEEKV